MDKGRKRKIGIAQILLFIILGFMALICLLPIVLIAIVALSSEASIAHKGFSFFPEEWSLAAVDYIIDYGDQIYRSYLVTIFETVSGTLLTLWLVSMFAYALSRKDFRLRSFLSIFLLITMLFNGGMLSNYLILTNVYKMKDNLLVLILPSAVSAFNVIVMRTFIQENVPESIVDAGKIDGAGHLRIYSIIVLPILKPVLAAVGFMAAVGHWNEWQTAFLYIDNPNLATLQLMLMRIEKNLAFLQENLQYLGIEQAKELANAPTYSARMAILLVTLGPILIAYPFFQKYFVKGLTVGAVKG